MNRSRLLIVGALISFSLALQGQDPDYTLRMSHELAAPGIPAEVRVTLDNTADPIMGWFFGACHDSTLAMVLTVELGEQALVADCGTPPDFQDSQIFPDGFTVGVLVDYLGQCPLEAGLDLELHVATYELLSTATAEVCFCNNLGSPPVPTGVVVAGETVIPITECGTISDAGDIPMFTRGDANGDSLLNIADPVFTLDHLFGGNPIAACEIALDTNDDEMVNVADVVFMLSHLFNDGPPPEAPFPRCGFDPTPGEISCADTGCP